MCEVLIKVGELNKPNKNGIIVYTEETVEKMKKRCKLGHLFGEADIPLVRGMSSNEVYNRIRTVNHREISHVVTDVCTSSDDSVYIKVKPMGAKGDALIEALEPAPSEFSISSCELKPEYKFAMRGIQFLETGKLEVTTWDLTHK